MTDKTRSKEEYGDWQTDMELALAVCRRLKSEGIDPEVLVEPTCGVGNFVVAALEVFDHVREIYAIEINPAYVHELSDRVLARAAGRGVRVHIMNQNVFDVDFLTIKRATHGRKMLILGNPPWVTNSQLGRLDSGNLPKKSNFKHVRGLDAITGKGNFDIAESITLRLLKLMEGERAHLALLLKSSVIRNIIYAQGHGRMAAAAGVGTFCQFNIDARREFQASVSAALLTAASGTTEATSCRVFDFYTGTYQKTFGWVGRHFVSDCDKYARAGTVEGVSDLEWRSGLKHDCAKVMELTRQGGHYVNGLGETVDIEEEMVYPFLKSSDIRGERVSSCRKYVILTQRHPSDDTTRLKACCPKAYRYLEAHLPYFEARKSVIYKNRPRFSIFGIGDYAFRKYRIAISGLYRQTRFSLVSEIGGKLALLDDTAYLVGFDTYEEAVATQRILNSDLVQDYMTSVLFEDAKRPINKEMLMRIDLSRLLQRQDGRLPRMDKRLFAEYVWKARPSVEPSLF